MRHDHRQKCHEFSSLCEMAAFVVTPVFLAAAFATGAHVLAKRAYPSETNSRAIMEQARAASDKVRKGFSDESDMKQIQFDMQVLSAMMTSVPEDARQEVQRAIDGVNEEYKSEEFRFFRRALANEANDIAAILTTPGSSREEVKKVRARLENVQKKLGKLHAEDRTQASSTVTSLFEQLDHVEQVLRYRTVMDNMKDLGDTQSNEEKVQRVRSLNEIINQLKTSSFASREDLDLARKLLKKVQEMKLISEQAEAQYSFDNKTRLKNLLDNYVVWSDAQMKEAEQLKKNLKDYVAEDRATKTQHQLMSESMTRLSTVPQNNIPESKLKLALDEATKLTAKLGERNLHSKGPHIREQASVLLKYISRFNLDNVTPKLASGTQFEMAAKIQKLQDQLVDLGGTREPEKTTTSSSGSDGTPETQVTNAKNIIVKHKALATARKWLEEAESRSNEVEASKKAKFDTDLQDAKDQLSKLNNQWKMRVNGLMTFFNSGNNNQRGPRNQQRNNDRLTLKPEGQLKPLTRDDVENEVQTLQNEPQARIQNDDKKKLDNMENALRNSS